MSLQLSHFSGPGRYNSSPFEVWGLGDLGGLGLDKGLVRRVYLDPKVCKIMAFMAVIMGLRLLVYILLGFR